MSILSFLFDFSLKTCFDGNKESSFLDSSAPKIQCFVPMVCYSLYSLLESPICHLIILNGEEYFIQHTILQVSYFSVVDVPAW